MWFLRMEFISDSIASSQLEASVALIASLYVVGSLESEKNNLGEYLSSGRVSLSDLQGKAHRFVNGLNGRSTRIVTFMSRGI